MFYLLFLTLLFPSAAIAESPLNWTALEVTAEEESPEPPPTVQTNSRFMTTFDKMRADFQKAAAERGRTVSAISNKQTVYSALEEFLETSYPGGVDGLVKSHKQIEEDIFRLLKTLPPVAYQYIGPYLHSLPHMSERVLNMPGIKETKGKFPTRIAPQMQEYAKKYGKYMSKYLYILLMPEAWGMIEREDANGSKSFVSEIVVKQRAFVPKTLLSKFDMLSPDDYRTGKALEKLHRPQTPSNKVDARSALTEGDVEASLASFESIDREFGNNRFDDFHKAIRDMSLTDNNLMEELRNPMQTLASKIKRLPQADKFAAVVAKHGFTIDSWAITTDKILKARRVATLGTGDAAALGYWRGLKALPPEFQMMTPRDRKITLDSLQLYLDLYSSTEENVLAVKNYGDNIRKVFSKRDMTVLETPVFGIY